MIAKEIRNIRTNLGLTQEQLGQIFDVTQRTIVRWEKGESIPQGTASNKVKLLMRLLSDKNVRSELKTFANQYDGVKAIKAFIESFIVNTCLGTQANGIAATLPFSIGDLASALTCLGSAALGGFVPGKLVGGLTTAAILGGLYPSISKCNESMASNTIESKTCMVCGNYEKGEMYRCNARQKDGTCCNFVSCKKCIYNSKDRHYKHSPECENVDVPAFQLIQE